MAAHSPTDHRLKTLEELIGQAFKKIRELQGRNTLMLQEKRFLEEECRKFQEKLKGWERLHQRHDKVKSRLERLASKLAKI